MSVSSSSINLSADLLISWWSLVKITDLPQFEQIKLWKGLGQRELIPSQHDIIYNGLARSFTLIYYIFYSSFYGVSDTLSLSLYHPHLQCLTFEPFLKHTTRLFITLAMFHTFSLSHSLMIHSYYLNVPLLKPSHTFKWPFSVSNIYQKTPTLQ